MMNNNTNPVSASGKTPFVRLDVEILSHPTGSTGAVPSIQAYIVQDGRRGRDLLYDIAPYPSVGAAMSAIRNALEGTYCNLVVFSGDIK